MSWLWLSGWELIDTLWNVNSEIHIHTENAFGINRYIMECKSFDDLDTGWDRCGINRYIMECKSYFFLTFCGWSFELIDTLWNVKDRI